MKMQNITKIKKVLLVAVIIGITFIFLTATRGETSNMDQKDHKYYFEMDQKTRREFLKKVRLIKKGDSVSEVKALLGEPTYDQVGMSKQGVYRFRVLDYYVKRWRKNFVNEKYDKLVSFYFDNKDKLVKISSNVEGFKRPF